MSIHLKRYAYLLLAMTAMVFYTCKDAEDDHTPQFSASLNDQAWQASTSNLKATFKNGQIILATGLCGMDFLFDGQTTGQYATGRDQYSFAIAQDQSCGEAFYTNLEELNTGTLEITAIDHNAKTISGKFSFTAKSKSGNTLRVRNGIFEDITYTEETGNLANQPVRGWIEENGKKYALNTANFTNYQFYGSNTAQEKILTLVFPATILMNGSHALSPLDVNDGNIRLVYNLIHSSVAVSEYDPAPGSQLQLTVIPGTGNDFSASFDLILRKDFGSGPDSLHLKGAFEVYQ